ncbi:MAG: DUF1826 domain-containing protein [Oligoflexales bacterium]|nr:DUF1826 domain-containing protein [Oligoflexales bacterium]
MGQNIGKIPSKTDHYFSSALPKDLANIYDEQVSLGVWNPPFDEKRSQYAHKLAASDFQFAEVVTLDSLKDHLENFPDFPGAKSMRAWIFELAEVFSLLFKQKKIGVKVSSQARPMCPKFHVDHVPARPLHCLHGESCLWIKDGNYFNKGSRVQDWVSKVEKTPEEVKVDQPPKGAVVIMKGTGWNSGSIPIIHRSPEHDSPRCVLTLDLADNISSFATRVSR